MTGDRIKCPQCGADNRADARWCASCAQPLETKPAAASASTPSSTPTATQPAPRRAAPAAPPPVQPRPASGGNGLTKLLAVLTVLFFITTVIFGLMALNPDAAPIKTSTVRAAAEAGDENEIKDVAREFSEDLVTFNHRSLDEDINRILGNATENFKNQFHTALGGDLNVFRNAIRESQSQSTGEVRGTSVESRDDDTATVLVFISQTIQNRRNTTPRTQLRLLELTLVKSGGDWKVDNVGNPGRSS